MVSDDVTTAKGRATRGRIVAAAAELMHRHGVAGTSTPAVRDAAGVSSSQIYHYFADKDALTRSVIDWWADRIVGTQVELLADVEDLAGLRRWRDAVVAGAGDNGGCPLGGLSSQLAEHAWARATSATGFHRWQTAISDALARLSRLGVLDPDVDPERCSLALLAAIQGGLLLGQATGSPRPLEAALDTVLDTLAPFTARSGAPRRTAPGRSHSPV